MLPMIVIGSIAIATIAAITTMTAKTASRIEHPSGARPDSGIFLLLDNTYGMSNMLEHVVLQMTNVKVDIFAF
jgi:hypothetical protein